MSYFNRLKTFLLTLICFPLSFLAWSTSTSLLILIIQYLCNENHGTVCFQDPKSSYFFKPNSEYGTSTPYSYTKKIQNDIYDNAGRKVGTYESDGPTYQGWEEDDRQYVIKMPLYLVYMFAFPFLKIGALIASFLALFTSRFYVSVKAPDDYSHEKYNRALHCLFNIVVERSEKGREKFIQKKKIKEEKLRIKQDKKEKRKEKRKEQVKIADKILGIVLKILGLVGILIALYFIVKGFL